MERITINKQLSLKSIILDGLKFQEYALVAKTLSDHPIYLYHSEHRHAVALYNCKRGYDEFIMLDTRRPDKIRLLIREFLRYRDDEFKEIADKMAVIIGGERPSEEKVVYLTKL
jgi:hypothetical protein